MPTPKAIKSQGTTVSYSLGSPSSYVQIGKVVDFAGPGGDSSVFDASDLDDTQYRRKLTGLIDAGALDLKLNFTPDDASHQALKLAQENQTLLEIKIVLPSGTLKTIKFDAYVKRLRIQGSADNKVVGDLSLEIDGAWAIS